MAVRASVGCKIFAIATSLLQAMKALDGQVRLECLTIVDFSDTNSKTENWHGSQ